MASAYPKYLDDEESSLMAKNEAYSAFPLEMDQVEQRYTNIRAASTFRSKLVQQLSKLALATTMLLIFAASYPYAVQFLKSSEVGANFKKEAVSVVKHPNFVFVLVDDAGWNSLGQTQFDLGFTTPFLNNLIANGITIENYYSQEMCTPARSALFTGRMPITVGMQYGAIGGTSEVAVPASEILVSDVLKKNGYTNYGLGKWNLGHYKPQFLPTARGFDYYLGFMDGANYYWSKKDPTNKAYYDFMYSDVHCYNRYDGDDLEDYSTDLYTTKAVGAIEAHDFNKSPMFLYMAYQAAHEPFHDYNYNNDGLTSDMVTDLLGSSEWYDKVMENVAGGERQQFALSLVMLDNSVSKLLEALHSKGQSENTYVIIASDNGGCYGSGGKNGPLRGSKGSLFEGGTKVGAYIYSAGLPSKLQGSTYKGLFHVTDWFPTMLGLAGIDYSSPGVGHALDGVDQSSQLLSFMDEGVTTVFPRTTVIYNIFSSVVHMDFDLEENAPFAVRNEQYKLLHAFTDNEESKTYNPDTLVENDDNLYQDSSCTESMSLDGTYTRFLFDLVNDPYEENNLYDDPKYGAVQAELYDIVHKAEIKEITSLKSCSSYTNDDGSSSTCEDVWMKRNYFVQPWAFSEEADAYGQSYPSYCLPNDNVFSPTRRR